MQTTDYPKLPVDEEWVTAADGTKARIVKPAGATGVLPVILYIHGAGWVFGNAHTHDRLVRELAVGAGAAVVFPEYDLSPEVRYPHALEQNYAVARWIIASGKEHGLDAGRLAIAGDSVGGNMTAAVTLLAKERGDVRFVQQVLFYPVTDASFDTASYHEFAEGREAARGRCPDDRRTVRRDHPRLRHAGRAPRYPRGDGGHRARHLDAPQGSQLTRSSSANAAASFGNV